MTVVVGVVVAALLLLVAAELAVRRLERRLPSYLHWHDHMTTGKWRQIRELRRRRTRVDIVLAGGSQINLALDPAVVGAPPYSCYNAALYRGIPSMSGEWVLDVVLPALRPRLLVWGLSSADINDGGELHRSSLARMDAAPARRKDLRGRLVARARLHSALARRSALLRHPRRSWRYVRTAESGETHEARLAKLLGPMGKGLEFADVPGFLLSEAKAAYLREQVVEGYRIGGPELAALRRVAEAATAAGAAMMIVEMPCTEEYFAMLPRGEADAEEARTLLAGLAADVGATWVPLKRPLPKEWFADPIHLNGRGMREWSREMAPLIRAAVPGVAA